MLRLIAGGLSNQLIGQRLLLALVTVKGHDRRIFDNLQCSGAQKLWPAHASRGCCNRSDPCWALRKCPARTNQHFDSHQSVYAGGLHSGILGVQ